MKRYLISEIDQLHIWGRTSYTDEGLNIFWTASGIEVNATGTEMYVELTADFGWYEPWIEIIIDGALSQRRMLEQGTQRICVYRAMEPGRVRNVRILQATQAPGNDPAAFLQLHALITDGDFAPVQPRAMKIEIIGDSITSCEGLSGSKSESAWNASIFSIFNGYPYLLGEMLQADVHVLSQSGYGVYCSWRGDVRESMPRFYPEICGPLSGGPGEKAGAHLPWDFAAWQPDVIIVNLGTNDSGSFDQAGVYFPDVDFRCPMRVDENGAMHEEDRQKVLQAAVDFLQVLRRRNPDSRIFWCYGMIPGRLEATLREAVACYRQETQDDKVEFLLLPQTLEEEIGSRMHPGAPAHRKVADVLCREIRAQEKQ